MIRTRLEQRSRRRGNRQALTLVVVLTCLAIAMLMMLSWIKTAALERRQLRELENQAQAVWLAESGLERAVWQLRTNTAYAGEVWQIAPADLGGNRAGAVTIRVEKPAATDSTETTASRAITVTADYPAESEHRARHTKQLTLKLTGTGATP